MAATILASSSGPLRAPGRSLAGRAASCAVRATLDIELRQASRNRICCSAVLLPRGGLADFNSLSPLLARRRCFSSTPSAPANGDGAESGDGSSAGSAAAAAPSSATTTGSRESTEAEATGPAAPKGQALFALPLFRKPAFPGFYHSIQIGDQEILDFLLSLKRNNQGDFLAGFITSSLPPGLSEADAEAAEPLVAAPPGKPGAGGEGKQASPKTLRRDTGKVESGEELAKIGTLLKISSIAAHPSVPGGQVVVFPTQRITLARTLSKPCEGTPLCAVWVETVPDVEVPPDSDDIRALHHEIIATMKDLLKTKFTFKEQFEQVIKYYNLDDPLKLADLVAGMSTAPREELQAVLESDVALVRLRKVLMIMKGDLEKARFQSQFKSQIEDKFAKEHRKYMLMQQLKHIKNELNLEKDDKQTLIIGFKEAIAKLEGVPEEATKAMEQEISRLGNLEPASPEFNVSRTYLEWMTVLPWSKTTTDNADIDRAEKILNEDHHSLEDVKELILEHMAVSFLKGSIQGKIMCLVGPPGTGKTSIGKSIARALDREFYSFSVGGLHDVAEIRGHRRTYVGAMPGRIIQALKISKVSNPVILIDEVDKLGRDSRGDPSSALLEVLDPAQNNAFRDLYLDVPVDLSKALFVCTANVSETIPGPLLDRMEVIRLSGYVFEEKLAIANQYLIPQTIKSHGIKEDTLDLRPEALQELIRNYAREAGVRELRKLLEKIARKVALTHVRTEEELRELAVVATDNLTKYVGQPPYTSDHLFHKGMPPGVVMGLAWTAMGGKTLFVEARGLLPRGEAERKDASAAAPTTSDVTVGEASEPAGATRAPTGAHLKVTGKLGKVMGESSDIALSYARLFLQEVEHTNSYLEQARMHLNVPEGAVPKDGPSAGVTMTSALLSLALDKSVRADLAMTGELTLTGKVLRVGGIKEKTIAARRENVGTLVLPMSNQADYAELKPHLRAGLTAHFVDHFDDVYRLAFEGTGAPMPLTSRGGEVVTIVTPPTEALLAPSLLGEAGATAAVAATC